MMIQVIANNLFNRVASCWSNNNQTRGQSLRRVIAPVIAPVIALVALLAIAGWSITKNAPNATARAAAFISIKLTFEIGKRTASGQCGPGFGICRVDLSLGRSARQNSVVVSATPLDDQRLECLFESAPPSRDRLLEIAEDKILDESIARKFGFKRMTILRGNYTFDSSKGKFGGVVLNLKTAK